MGGGAKCIVAGVTPVSFFPAEAFTPDPVSSDTVAGTRVRLEASPEILAKKLVYRVGAGEEAVRAGSSSAWRMSRWSWEGGTSLSTRSTGISGGDRPVYAADASGTGAVS